VKAALLLGLSVLLVCSLFLTLACVLVVRLFVRLLRQGYAGGEVAKSHALPAPTR
jgi:hypothetical protein